MKNITAERFTNGKPNLRRFHQARWMNRSSLN